MKIEIKNRYSKKVIFSHEQENNSLKNTIELAMMLIYTSMNLEKLNFYRSK